MDAKHNRIKHNYKKLSKELFNLPFGDFDFCNLSPEAQIYITERYIIGLSLIPCKMRTGESGSNNFLGSWSFAKSKGVRSHVNLNKVWVATLFNARGLELDNLY